MLMEPSTHLDLLSSFFLKNKYLYTMCCTASLFAGDSLSSWGLAASVNRRLGGIPTRRHFPLAFQTADQSLDVLQLVHGTLQRWLGGQRCPRVAGFRDGQIRKRTGFPTAPSLGGFRADVQAGGQAGGEEAGAGRNGHRNLVRVETRARSSAAQEGVPGQ